MKKILFFLVIFIFSALVIINAQEAKKDSIKGKAKKLSALRIGVDPQNFLRDIKPGEVLVKYIGKRWLPIKTGSGSGKFSNGLLTPGAGLIVPDQYKKSDKITNFDIWWCGNASETLKGKKGTSLYIPTDSLQWVVSGNELVNIHSSSSGFDNEKLSKLIELVEKIFGNGGELELMGDNLVALNEKIDIIQSSISDIRMSLGLKPISEEKKQEKVEESSGNFWGSVLKIAAGIVITGAVVALGVVVYKALDHKDATPTVIVNIPSSGGPVNPKN